MKTVTGDRELDRLRKAHRNLDEELHALTRRPHLTPTEQERARVLKKEKLRTKDSIRVLMGDFKFG